MPRSGSCLCEKVGSSANSVDNLFFHFVYVRVSPLALDVCPKVQIIASDRFDSFTNVYLITSNKGTNFLNNRE